jgi:hypothetical protein
MRRNFMNAAVVRISGNGPIKHGARAGFHRACDRVKNQPGDAISKGATGQERQRTSPSNRPAFISLTPDFRVRVAPMGSVASKEPVSE